MAGAFMIFGASFCNIDYLLDGMNMGNRRDNRGGGKTWGKREG
ncbi:hypothetical protein AEQU2_03056 [Aequorivita lipolytica]|nr:hypothetical protein AEQU2_03056 [Aequorivita lipolytica]